MGYDEMEEPAPLITIHSCHATNIAAAQPIYSPVHIHGLGLGCSLTFHGGHFAASWFSVSGGGTGTTGMANTWHSTLEEYHH